MLHSLPDLAQARPQTLRSGDVPLAYLQLAAAAFAAWYILALWVWSRYRAADRSWYEILRGGWVLLDRNTFRSDGWRALALVRWAFVLVVIPLIAGVLFLSTR